MKIIRRLFELNLPLGQSAFLWGPRRVGKTYWISQHLVDCVLIDLLKTDIFAEYASRPALLRERYQEGKERLIVIDEVQKVPALLDEVHWLIENKKLAFLLTGSSARKLKRGHANLLAGRAWRKTMTPLSCLEVDTWDLEKVMISGLLPPHYLSADPLQDLRAYVADYLKEEIAAEALTQNMPTFTEFLRVAAITSSELINYENIARECGVSHKVVRGYFDILEDTYLGFRIPAWKKTLQRRLITTDRFYLFDVGIANFLARRKPAPGTPEFGKSFEQYILMELKAYQAYQDPDLPISFLRTAGGVEVDFILGDMEIAVEVKGTNRVQDTHLRALISLQKEFSVKQALVVSLEAEPRTLHREGGAIKILPYRLFIEGLWGGEYL